MPPASRARQPLGFQQIGFPPLQFIFRSFALINVGTQATPAGNFAVPVPQRQRGQMEPAKGAVTPAQSGFPIKWFPRLERMAPLTHNPLAIIWMENTLIAAQLSKRAA